MVYSLIRSKITLHLKKNKKFNPEKLVNYIVNLLIFMINQACLDYITSKPTFKEEK